MPNESIKRKLERLRNPSVANRPTAEVLLTARLSLLRFIREAFGAS